MQLTPSILQDGAARADDHDGPIAESRHAVHAEDSARGGEDAPARAIPVLDGRTDGTDALGRDSRDPSQQAGAPGIRVRAGNAAPTGAVPLRDRRFGIGRWGSLRSP